MVLDDARRRGVVVGDERRRGEEMPLDLEEQVGEPD